MKRGPASGRTPIDYLAKAEEAWGAPPDFVVALAEECARTSAAKVAQRVGYSTAVISEVIANKYRGDTDRVAEKIRGALMGVVVLCPVLGEIGRHRCLDEQKHPFTVTSSMRARLYRACRGGCPHFRNGFKGASNDQ